MALEEIGSAIGSFFDKEGSNKGSSTGAAFGKSLNAILDITSSSSASSPAPKQQTVPAPDATQNGTGNNEETSEQKAEKAAKEKAAKEKADKAALEANNGKTQTAETKENNIFRQFFQFLASLFGAGPLNFGDQSTNTGSPSATAGSRQNPHLPSIAIPPGTVANDRGQEQNQKNGLLDKVFDLVGSLFKGKETIAESDASKAQAKADLAASFTTKAGKTLDPNQAKDRSDIQCQAEEALTHAFANGLNASEQKAFNKLKNEIGDSLKKDGHLSDKETANIMSAIQALNTAASKDTPRGQSR